MAYTRIHAIKNTVNAAASYICDPAKTEENTLVTSFACSPRTAEHDFRFALSKTNERDKNLAYHLIQSFAPGELSPKEAHAIGVELADQLLKGKYSYIVSTHTNTDSVHNHILFCAADNIDHRKFNSCRKSYREIRSISDRLCAEHNLSIIQPDAAQSRDYRRSLLQLTQKESDWKSTLCHDIDDAIRTAVDYESFLELMLAKGYEMKGTSPDPGAHKYIAFRPTGKERFIRGSAKSLGSQYTREMTLSRISNNQTSRVSAARLKSTADQMPAFSLDMPIVNNQPLVKEMSTEELLKKGLRKQDPHKRFSDKSSSGSYHFIDETSKKIASSPGLTNWAKRQNLKTAASIYAAIDDLDQEIAVKKEVLNQTKISIKKLSNQIKQISEVVKYVEQYQAYKPVHEKYLKVKSQEAFFRKHEPELLLFDGAHAMLKKTGVNPDMVNPPDLRTRLGQLEQAKETTVQNRNQVQKRLKTLRENQKNLYDYFLKDTITRDIYHTTRI